MSEKQSKEVLRALSALVLTLNTEQKRLLKTQLNEQNTVPLSIFTTNLSGLEALVFYLKTTQNLSIKQISQQLNRSLSTIYTTYHNAKNKYKPAKKQAVEILIPLNLFTKRKYSTLELLIHHLRTEHNLSLKKISLILNKNYSTIKTLSWRHSKK